MGDPGGASGADGVAALGLCERDGADGEEEAGVPGSAGVRVCFVEEVGMGDAGASAFGDLVPGGGSDARLAQG